MPYRPTPRFVGCICERSSGRSRSYRHSRSPLSASSASTWLFGVVTNIAPLFTTGGAWWPSRIPVENDQTGLRSATFSVLI